jgi:hypothetical protein
MSGLNSLKLVSASQKKTANPMELKRKKLSSKLDEQIQLARRSSLDPAMRQQSSKQSRIP